MAWIRWRKTKDGARLASLQWRDAGGRVRSKALGTSDERLAQLHLDALRTQLGQRQRVRPGEVDAHGVAAHELDGRFPGIHRADRSHATAQETELSHGLCLAIE